MNTTVWQQSKFVLVQKWFSGFDSKFRICDAQGQPLLFAKKKAFKLKEDLRVYFNEAMTEEALVIKARRIIDFGAAYDVYDPATNQRIGTFRRKGLKSMLRDEWAILNFDDQPIGKIEEDSLWMALVRRFLWSLMSQNYHASIQETTVASYRRPLSLFVMKMTLDILPAASGKVDPRVLVAGVMLLSAIEGRQA